MVEVKQEGVIGCQKPGCNVQFRAGNGPQTDHELILREAVDHERRRHIGVASLVNLERREGKEPEPQNDEFYHLIELTLNGPEILTLKPVTLAYARSAASSLISDRVPEYFK